MACLTIREILENQLFTGAQEIRSSLQLKSGHYVLSLIQQTDLWQDIISSGSWFMCFCRGEIYLVVKKLYLLDLNENKHISDTS